MSATRFLIQVSLTAETAASSSADLCMTINAPDCLAALHKAFAAHPSAVCFDAYIGRGDFRHVGTFGTELPGQWGSLAAGVAS
jgi:hypothetical protein